MQNVPHSATATLTDDEMDRVSGGVDSFTTRCSVISSTKADGTYPDQRDPLGGRVAIMLAVDDCPPIALTTGARNVQSIIKRPPVSTGTHQHSYAETVVSIANSIRSGETKADDDKAAFAFAAIWTAFNHPMGGIDVARKVSDFLHRGKTPHIT